MNYCKTSQRPFATAEKCTFCGYMHPKVVTFSLNHPLPISSQENGPGLLSLAKAEQMEGTWVVAVGLLLLGSGCLLQPTAFMMVMRVLPHMDSSSSLKMICLSSSMSTYCKGLI